MVLVKAPKLGNMLCLIHNEALVSKRRMLKVCTGQLKGWRNRFKQWHSL